MPQVHRRVLPGFRLSLGFSLLYLGVLVLIPLLACIVTTVTKLSLSEFLAAAWTPRARHAYALTILASFLAACISIVIGGILAWTLSRYEFPLKRIFDALIDLPFALPTAVAGLIFSNLLVGNGWFGQFLVPLGIDIAYTRAGIVMMMVFIGFPFVVRTLQPILETLDADVEEAARLLGASRWQTFRRVIFPALVPGFLTSFALALARGLGEYGSVVFISTNIPNESEIAAVLVVNRLEEFRYAEASAVATMMLAMSFGMLILVNLLERRSRRWD